MYRARQFFSALIAQTDNTHGRELNQLLTSPQQNLFRRMALSDQRHSLDVCATLCQAGHNAPDLLAAALLHDVGKAAGRIWLWQRILIVLLERSGPGVLRWLARGSHQSDAPRWRRGFVINRLHPELGAHWAAEAGCSPMTVALVRRHQIPVKTINDDQDRLLAMLQWADGVN